MEINRCGKMWGAVIIWFLNKVTCNVLSQKSVRPTCHAEKSVRKHFCFLLDNFDGEWVWRSVDSKIWSGL